MLTLKRILITGASGQIGQAVTQKLLQYDDEYVISCFMRKSSKNKRIARSFGKKVDIVWGDIRKRKEVEKAVKSQDIIIHLAFYLPPISIEQFDIAYETNVKGMENLIQAAQQNNSKILFSSSFATYGDIRSLGDESVPLNQKYNPPPKDYYSHHKVKCINLLKESGLDYAIFVLALIPPKKNLLKMSNDQMFEIPLDTRVELADEDDVAEAIVSGLSNGEIWNKTHHIGGGESCRVLYSEFIQKMMTTMGVGEIPEELFGGEKYHFCYLSSEKTNKLLDYQTHSFEDILNDMKRNNRGLIFFIRLFRPIVRRILFRSSPYFEKLKNSKNEN
ncbi:MAG: SDR family NAD(P)-dependent oxidoreductase [Candidatus Heimdallarchaeota archaeon]|nr:SDR family NAD(P)-dependent oxidoreductase [Candidatus Heimdallarchaeota archaeon]